MCISNPKTPRTPTLRTRNSLVTLGGAGATGAAAAGPALLAVRLLVEALGADLAPQPRVAIETGTLPRRDVAFGRAGAPHDAAVADVSCKEKKRMKPVWGRHNVEQEPTRGIVSTAALPLLTPVWKHRHR